MPNGIKAKQGIAQGRFLLEPVNNLCPMLLVNNPLEKPSQITQDLPFNPIRHIFSYDQSAEIYQPFYCQAIGIIRFVHKEALIPSHKKPPL